MIRVIPAIDLLGGKCVRLTRGDYDTSKVYSADPLDMAKDFEQKGIKYLHLVDLDGARSKHVVNLPVLEQIVSHTNLIVDFGGGIKSDRDINSVFNAGAAQVIVGSMAVTDKSKFLQWLSDYGSDKIILGADVRDNKIAVSGWIDTTSVFITGFLNDYIKQGVKNVLCTDISRDGMLSGSSVSLYVELMNAFPGLHLIASGGVATIHDIELLDKTGIPAVVVGKAIYEGRIMIEQLIKYQS